MTRRVRLFRLREWLTMSLWVVPAAGVTAAVVLAEVLVALDRRMGNEVLAPLPLVDAGADSAQTILSVIAGSMVTSISLIFSVTMVVLQLASAQYSPRVLAGFIRDRFVQAVLAAYIGTFVYALLLLPTIHKASPDEEEFVPGLAVTVALGLALASLGLFVRYVHHVAHAIRAVTIISKVAEETRSAVERMYPDMVGEPSDDVHERPSEEGSSIVAWPSPPGVLVAVDEGALLSLAEQWDVVIALQRSVGEFVPTNGPLFRVFGGVRDQDALRACATVGVERTMNQDAAYGFRQIVDIAERALSPGINDPTTAVQCIDHLHDLLRRIAVAEIPSQFRADADGTLRVIAPRPGWEDYVHLAFDEIRHYSERSIQVATRLTAAIDDLLVVAPPHRRRALQHQLDLVRRSVTRSFDDEADQSIRR